MGKAQPMKVRKNERKAQSLEIKKGEPNPWREKNKLWALGRKEVLREAWARLKQELASKEA